MGYRKLDEQDIAYLKRVTEDERVLTAARTAPPFSHKGGGAASSQNTLPHRLLFYLFLSCNPSLVSKLQPPQILTPLLSSW